jgi:hypothetical protein
MLCYPTCASQVRGRLFPSVRTQRILNPAPVAGAHHSYKDEMGDLMTPEPFVSADAAAQFLSIKRRYLLALARKGIAGAYALGTGTVRKIWVFRLSELAAALASKRQ